MRSINIKTAALLLLWIFSGITFSSAQDVQDRGVTDMNELLLFYSHAFIYDPWQLLTNPAGLIFTPAVKISNTKAGYSYRNDQVRRSMDPGTINGFHVVTRNTQRLGRVIVAGQFGYQNQHYGDILYNGNMDFRYMNLYMLGDTVGGKQRQEGYFFDASIAYPLLDNRISVGLAIDYESAIGAKMKDLRNLNTITRTRITPGVVYSGERWTAGLSGGPVIDNNLTEVNAQLDERHTLFYHMGMGHYSASGNFTGSESVLYEGRGFHTEIQFMHGGESRRGLHSVNLLHLVTQARVGSTYRLINGITDYDKLSYNGSYLVKRESGIHHFSLRACAARLYATEVRQESYSQSVGGVFYTLIRTLRWIEGKHIVYDLSGDISYSYSRRGIVRPLKYQFSITPGGGYYSSTHYPTESYGKYSALYLEGNATFNAFLTAGRINIDPSAGISTRIVPQSEVIYRELPNYLEAVPELDYRYFSREYVGFKWGVTFSGRDLLPRVATKLYLRTEGSYAAFHLLPEKGMRNISADVTVGAIF